MAVRERRYPYSLQGSLPSLQISIWHCFMAASAVSWDWGVTQAQRAGYRCAVAFVIQMEGITEVRPNVDTQPEFGTALAEAKAAGVSVLFLLCHVGRDSLEIVEQREA